MNISLTPHLEDFISSKVESGRYRSASEVVREGLRLLEEQDHLTRLRRERLTQLVEQGLDDIDQGRVSVLSSELRDEIKQAARAKHSARSE